MNGKTGYTKSEIIFGFLIPILFVSIIGGSLIYAYTQYKEVAPLYEKELKEIRSMSCDALRIKILNQDFIIPLGSTSQKNEEQSIFEYTWRCEKA